MFCGWGHKKSCRCLPCVSFKEWSAKQAYRYALASAKSQSKEVTDMALRKPLPGQQYGQAAPMFDDQDFRQLYPNLYEYLFTDRWADGSVRQTSTLSVFSDNGALKVVLNDRDNNRSAFFSAKRFNEALESMETALREETVDWKSRSHTKPAGQTPF